MKTYFVYILTNKRFTVLYTGVTSNLEQRVFEHKTKFYIDSFTARYQCDRLVYFEEFSDVEEAIKREKQLKRYKREWKANLVNQMNPKWEDLSGGWYDPKSITLGLSLNRKE
jgi:putative endonuclease